MKHGSYVTYKTKNCRCRPCTDDANRQQKWYKLRVIANAGQPTMVAAELCGERLRALRAAGYGGPFLARAANVDVSQIRRISDGRQPFVWLRTFQAIERVWETYQDVPGTDRKAMTWAAKRGWKPPARLPMPEPVDEDSVDEVAVERAVAGDKVPLTRAESAEAWRRLEKQGLSANEIALRLHTTRKSVERWRSGQIARPASTRARADRTRSA